MTYSVQITRKAERDIQAAADYIEFELFNRTAADSLLEDVEKAITSLAEFPEKHQLADDPVLRSLGIRYFPVDRYLVFYIVVDDEVYIIRFMYQRRDWAAILRQAAAGEDQ